jgi:hypothetical protein
MISGGIEFTEEVFRKNNSDYMCRIVSNIKIYIDDIIVDGVLVADIDGAKIAYTNKYFRENFYVFDAGETPAAIMQKDENGNN